VKPLSHKIAQIEESHTLVFTQKARAMRAAGIDVASLTAGEPDFATPAHIKMAAIQAIDEDFTHYTDNQGTPGLIGAVIQKFATENNLQFEPSQILVSCGAKHSIYNVMQALCNKGDEVVIAAPYWVSYPEIVKLADARPVIVAATHETQFKISAVQLRRAINEKTKAFIFNSPSNPTGAVYSQGEIEELADVIQETGVYVISDEIYEKIVYDGAKHFSIGSIKEIRDQVITVNGVSKAFAMTGWRLGYLGAAEPVAQAAAKVQSQITSNATSVSQRAAEVGLKAPTGDVAAMTAAFKRRRDFAVSELMKIPGITLSAPKGAFYLFPSMEHFIGKRVGGKIMKDDYDLAGFFLEEEHLALVPGSAFGAKNYVRLSYACSMKELQKGLERFTRGCRMLEDAY
jgi:aspartate aminotransferase